MLKVFKVSDYLWYIYIHVYPYMRQYIEHLSIFFHLFFVKTFVVQVTVKTLYNVTRYNRIFNIQHKIAGHGSVSIQIHSL